MQFILMTGEEVSEREEKKGLTNFRPRQARGPSENGWDASRIFLVFELSRAISLVGILMGNRSLLAIAWLRRHLPRQQPVLYGNSCSWALVFFVHGRNRRGFTPAGKEYPLTESPPGGIRRDRENATGDDMGMASSTAACRYLRFAAFAAVMSSELLKAARTSICNFRSVSGYRGRW